MVNTTQNLCACMRLEINKKIEDELNSHENAINTGYVRDFIFKAVQQVRETWVCSCGCNKNI